MNLNHTTLARKMAAADRQAASMIAARRLLHGDLRMEEIEGDEDEPDEGSDDDQEDDDPDESGDGDDQDDADKDKDKDADKVDRSEYDRVKRHRAAADRKAATLTAENTALKNEVAALKADGKDGKPDEATTARITSLESESQKKDQTINNLRIENAFLTANTHEWADVRDAMRLADLSDVEIDVEDGTVHGLKQALDKLAKDKPHLLKPKTGTQRGSSGGANNSKRKGAGTKVDRATLAQNYPVLRNRR